MELPNIIIPGAPKAGTTSITAILDQHPDVFMPALKEPRFFISDVIKNLSDQDPLKKYLFDISIHDWEKYKKMYDVDAKFKIDGSIQYLFYYKNTIPLIKKHLGDPYIILILRNPIYRALSNYSFNKRSEKCSTLIEAIKDELNGGRENLNSFYHYYGQGLYYEQVKQFQENFTNVSVLFYEDFSRDNLAFVNSICDILKISRIEKIQDLPNLNTSANLTFIGQLIIGNRSPLNLLFKYIMPYFINRGTLYQAKIKLKAKFAQKDEKIILSEEDKSYLRNLYKDDVAKLMGLLNMAKAPWKEFNNLS